MAIAVAAALLADGGRDTAAPIRVAAREPGGVTVDVGAGPPASSLAGCRADADCDDGDACTTDACAATGRCAHEPRYSLACRPSIEIDSPARAAALTSGSGATVAVRGSVHTGYGTVTALTLNGASVPVAADGGFAVDVDAHAGGNPLVFAASDSNGWARRHVQSFLWSTGYRDPGDASQGADPRALLLHVGPDALDDVAAVARRVIDAADFTAALDDTRPVASSAGYEIYVGEVDKERVALALAFADGGVHVEASLRDVSGALRFDCTRPACVLSGGDGTGRFGFDAIDVAADLRITLDGTRAGVALDGLTTRVGSLSLSSSSAWTDFLLGAARPGIAKHATVALEDALHDQLARMVASSGLPASSLTGAHSLALRGLGQEGETIGVRMTVALASAAFTGAPAPAGAFVFRGAVTPARNVASAPDVGVPESVACEATHAPAALPGRAPLELGVADTWLNQLLHAAWRGGLLVFSLPEIGARVEGGLPPTLTDCHAGRSLEAHVGELTITGQDFVAHTSLSLAVALVAQDDGLALVAVSIPWMQTELSVTDPDGLAREDALRVALEAELAAHLLDRLGRPGLATVSWPSFDVSAHIGLAAGTTALRPTIDEVRRSPGLSVVVGHL